MFFIKHTQEYWIKSSSSGCDIKRHYGYENQLLNKACAEDQSPVWVSWGHIIQSTTSIQSEEQNWSHKVRR